LIQISSSVVVRAAIFRHACGKDLEGIVSMRRGSRYVSGRTRAWLKTSRKPQDRMVGPEGEA
jgi:ATP-dependent DNA ligase